MSQGPSSTRTADSFNPGAGEPPGAGDRSPDRAGPSPAAESLESLTKRLSSLRALVADLERALPQSPAAPPLPPPDPAASGTAPAQPPPAGDDDPVVIAYNLETVITQWSAGAARLFGWTEDEAVGRLTAELILPEMATPALSRMFTKAIADGQIPASQSLHKTKDGRLITCFWLNAIRRDAQGNPIEVVSVVEDFSDEQRAVLSLHESHRLLSLVLDNTPDLIFLKDLDGRYILVNRACAELFRMHPSEIVGRADGEMGMISPEMAAAFIAEDRAILASGRVSTFEQDVPTPEGERSFLTYKFPVTDELGNAIGVCGISVDVTEERRAEAERAALQEQVIAAQKSALCELTAPLVPIADHVIAVPIVSSIDAESARRITEVLLEGIRRQRAHTVILDVTGVGVLDESTADALCQAARAARLLGARVILTGIRAEAAQALAQMGADMSVVVTLGTLESGIAYALAR